MYGTYRICSLYTKHVSWGKYTHNIHVLLYNVYVPVVDTKKSEMKTVTQRSKDGLGEGDGIGQGPGKSSYQES